MAYYQTYVKRGTPIQLLLGVLTDSANLFSKIAFDMELIASNDINRTFHSDVTRRVTWSSAATGWQKREVGGHLPCVYALQ